MTLSRIEQLAERVEAIVVGPQYSFGTKELAFPKALPSVVWVPAEDAYGPPMAVGGAQRAKLTRVAGLDAHVWGASLNQAETLVDQLILAALSFGGGTVSIVRGVWVTQEARKAGWTVAGELYVLSLTLAMPVFHAVDATVSITAVVLDGTGAVRGDGVLQAGEET